MPNKKRLCVPLVSSTTMGTVPPELTKDVLLQVLEDAGTSFERGELAYLAVTSKVEFPAPELRRWVVKYSSGIIGAAKSHGPAGQEAARQSLGDELSQLGPSDCREMPSGSVWGLDVIVDAWLVGPISRPRLADP
jgi:hypothetical protein